MFERVFKLKENGTTVRTEVLAGFTTFMTMAYIIVVNPMILSKAGMPFGAVFTATIIASIIAMLIMTFWANLPFAIAPGMGLNAFFVYTVVMAMGYSWEFALTAVFLEGLLFILLTAFKVREAIVDSIPLSLKRAISCGIGLFIAFIGLSNAGIIVTGESIVNHGKELSGTLVSLGNLTTPTAIVAIAGIFVGGILLVKKVRGALFIAIIFSTVLGVFLGITHLPVGAKFFSLPPSLAPTFLKFQFHDIFTLKMLVVVLTFLFIDMFNTVGTLIGVGAKAKMLDKDGKFPRIKQALFADCIGTTCGSILGTSTMATFIESASGIAEGGRTGLTTFVVLILFGVSLFFAPVFAIIPTAATTCALVLVGMFMMSPILDIDFHDYEEAIPAFLTILMMPLTYSIAVGIGSGIVSFFCLSIFTKNRNKIKPVLVVFMVLFVAKFFII